MRGTGLIERRQFIRAAGAAFVASLAPSAAFALSRAEAVFATGLRHPDGRFAIGLLTERGDFISEISLPGRIHGLCVSRVAGLAVAFARRPGTFAVIFDQKGHAAPRIISAPEGRHFFGHGSFSPDGRLLYASENDFDANRGMIGIYDAADSFNRIGEVPAHGIGTHDMTVSDDGKLLLIANGGIETHPDFGRTKLNLDHMEPSLVIADAATGSVIQKHSLPEALRQLSTRHLALADNGRIWFACQYEGPRNERPPLVGYFARGEDLTLVDLPDETTDRMGNYVGAIAVNNALGLVGLSSPSKGLSITLDGRTGSLLEERVLLDAAGIAASAQGFALSSYRGDFADRRHDLAFDQHIMRL
ncbi:DUF1513 domain-containing protein [Peteryoungia desertarenae]|uniref:DUF1513 domain-containing protein n=1 Tax=Peteryoungia desertarenae TaxID=1813451 RepID=A0ABX6QKQ0_9HYPH|nr:DUF1513 domain-containing protein [Peteryoungia desertarenae]QLF69139.1 DUF1513 domain-containing protein [Peteryoungia desertarenae]